MARRGARRGRDPVVGRSASTSARSPGATTTTRRRCRPTRGSSSHDALHRNPGAWQALTPPDADRVVRLRAGAAERHRRHRPPDGALRRAPARGAAGDRRSPGSAPTRCPTAQRRVHLGVPTANGTPVGRAERGHATSSPPATSSTSPTTRSCRGRASSRCRPACAMRPPGEDGAVRRSPRHVELRYETFVCDDAPTATRGLRPGPTC